MLVLSRHKNERIFIAGGSIVITVADIRGDKVRIGIDAPPSIDIHREEVWREIEADRRRAEGGER